MCLILMFVIEPTKKNELLQYSLLQCYFRHDQYDGVNVNINDLVKLALIISDHLLFNVFCT